MSACGVDFDGTPCTQDSMRLDQAFRTPPSDHPGCKAIWKHVLIIRGLAMLVSHAIQGLEYHINAINMPDLFSGCRSLIDSIEAAGAL